MKRILSILFIWILAVTGFSANYYVATDGSATNSGSISSPWTIQFAMTNRAQVGAGDTVWMREGFYNTLQTNWPYVCVYTVYGTPASPITVRNYGYERVVIDGGFYNYTSPSSNVVIFGLEFTCSGARTNTYEGRPGALSMVDGSKVINCVFHNTGQAGVGGVPKEVYGNVLAGVGIREYDYVTHWPTNPWTRGSALYLQHQGTNQILVSDNISGRNFTTGMKAYAQSTYAENFLFDGNITYMTGGETIEVECTDFVITNASVVNNVMYHGTKTPMGYYSYDNSWHESLTFSNNYILEAPGPGVAALWVKRWRYPTVVSNTIVATCRTNDWRAGLGFGNPDEFGGKFLEVYPSTNSSNIVINGNRYYGGVEQGGDWYASSGTNFGIFYHTYQPFRWRTASPPVVDGTNGNLSFAYWTNVHGFDVNSSYTTNMPTANYAMLRTNKYEAGRAHLVVINWETNSYYPLDLSLVGLTNGQSYEIRDAQNFGGEPLIRSRFDQSNPIVQVSLTSTNIQQILDPGDVFYFDANSHSSSLFNVFVVRPITDIRFGGYKVRGIRLR